MITVVRAFSPIDLIRRTSVPAALVLAVLLVGGCGGATGAAQKAGPTTSTATPVVAGVVLNVTGTEYSFAPAAPKASAGLTTIRFTNGGAVDHDFSIDALHVHVLAKPGKAGEAILTLKRGAYTFYCSVPGHRQSGMQGTLTVS